MKNSNSDKFSFNGKEKKGNNNHAYKEKYDKTDMSRPGLSVFHLGLGDYLCIVRETGFFLNKKCDCWQIRKLEKAVSNSFFIKIIFKT